MPNSHQAAAPQPDLRSPDTEAGTLETPVREYIGAMALELAQMARFDGDEPLAVILGAAADRAAKRETGLLILPGQPEPSIKRPS